MEWRAFAKIQRTGDKRSPYITGLGDNPEAHVKTPCLSVVNVKFFLALLFFRYHFLSIFGHKEQIRGPVVEIRIESQRV